MKHCLSISKIILSSCLYAYSVLSYALPTDIFSLSLEELLKVKIVVSATGYEQKIENAPSTVTIILRQEWEAMGLNDLYQVLATVAGVHIGIDESVSKTKSILIRGLGSGRTQIKILINGQSFDDRTRARIKPTNNFSLVGFKRIEVVKGPASAIYGADAFAGVINLVSEDVGDGDNNRFVVQGGSYGYKNFNVTHGGNKGKLDWFLSAQREESDLTERFIQTDAQTGLDLAPFSALTPPASNAPGFLQDWFETSSLMLNLSYDAFSLELIDWHTNKGFLLGVTNRIDDMDNPVSHVELKHSSFRSSYDLNTLSKSILGKLKLEFTYEDSIELSDFMIFPQGAVVLVGNDGNLFSPGAYPAKLIDDGLFTTVQLNNEAGNIKLSHIFRANDEHGIRWELGYEKLKFDFDFVRMFGPGITDSDTLPRPLDGSPLILGALGSGVDVHDSPENQFIIPAKRSFWFVSLQDEWTPTNNLNIVLGLRHDQYSDFGGTTNPRIGINWQLNNKLKLKVFHGSAFRAPAFGELYTKNNTAIDGNENLQSERINTTEVGFNYDLLSKLNLLISGTYYYFKTDDIIRDLPNPATGKLLSQNTDGEVGKGIELEALWKPLYNLSLRLNYSNSSLKNELSNEQRANIPDTLIYLNINWRISASFNWNIGVKSVAGRQRSSDDFREAVDDYISVSTRLAWSNVLPNLTIAISGTNITDSRYTEPGPSFLADDIPIAGEVYKIGFSYDF